jgi:hypothetical protein
MKFGYILKGVMLDNVFILPHLFSPTQLINSANHEIIADIDIELLIALV